MNCAEIRWLIHADADAELDAANSLQLELHLQACPACAAERTSLQLLRQAVRGANLGFPAPDSLRNDVRQFVRDLNANAALPRGFSLQVFWKFLALGSTALALLLIFLRPSAVSGRDAMLREVTASHVRSLQADHLTDVASSDQHTVKPWFGGRVDFAPDVKDFTEENFPLVGGRLDYFQGHAVAALVYRRNQHLINVFVWPGAEAASPVRTSTMRGYSLVAFDAHGLHHCLVSDLNEKELNALAELLRR